MVELAFGYRAIRYRTDLNFFWYTIHDLIELVANPASRNGLAFINGGDQRGYGLEWEFGMDITPNVGLRWNYAYQNASVDDDNVNIRFAPTHQVYGEANWRFAPQWNLNVNVKSILDRDRPVTDPRPPVENYSIVNLTLRRQNIVKQLDLALSARNLLDEDARRAERFPSLDPLRHPVAGTKLLRRGALPVLRCVHTCPFVCPADPVYTPCNRCDDECRRQDICHGVVPEVQPETCISDHRGDEEK
jgi:outer membrane receptor for ferrienterochelin and colicin